MMKDAIDSVVKLESMTLTLDTDVVKDMNNKTIKEMK